MSYQIITSELLHEDPDLIDLVDRFVSRLPDMQSVIIKAFDEKDWEKFVHLIHQMKGVGGNYGYSMLTNLCADIELKVKEESFIEVGDKLNDFQVMIEGILAGRNENHKIVKR